MDHLVGGKRLGYAYSLGILIAVNNAAKITESYTLTI